MLEKSLFLDLMQRYSPVIVATLFGALAHAFEEVKKEGWRGWFAFISDILVCSFTGFAFYHLSMVINPTYAVLFTSLGSYWGTKGFVLIRDWVFKSIKANIEK